jgi:environmental stress-induced protein Ves
MNQVTRIARDSFIDMPWKNGQGRTFEIAKRDWDTGSGPSTLWRLSVAEIGTDCDFSIFPHLDRYLAVIQGTGIALDFADDRPQARLEMHQSVTFAGEMPISCRLLGGPTRDLNLMVDRRAARFTAEIARGFRPVASADIVALVCLEGTLTIGSAHLQPGDAAISEGAMPAVDAGRSAVFFQGLITLERKQAS